jgi:hypothetical protein
MKTKIFFIKSVYDYTYPQIMVQKLKTMKAITNKFQKKSIVFEAQKYLKKPETYIDRLIIQGRKFNVETENEIISLDHNKTKKNKNAKFFKT